jgi:hypothetical protein
MHFLNALLKNAINIIIDILYFKDYRDESM